MHTLKGIQYQGIKGSKTDPSQGFLRSCPCIHSRSGGLDKFKTCCHYQFQPDLACLALALRGSVWGTGTAAGSWATAETCAATSSQVPPIAQTPTTRGELNKDTRRHKYPGTLTTLEFRPFLSGGSSDANAILSSRPAEKYLGGHFWIDSLSVCQSPKKAFFKCQPGAHKLDRQALWPRMRHLETVDFLPSFNSFLAFPPTG
jgi:hypothetical protein